MTFMSTNIFDFSFKNWHTLNLTINWMVIIVIIIISFAVSIFWKKLMKFSINNSIQIDEVVLGIGNSSLKLKYNKKDQEIAYKLWVELSTRKIGLEFEQDYDVITEVYNSWYNFFEIARELMKEIPCEKFDSSYNLVQLTWDVLNDGLRPHLTHWQAMFRKWYEVNCKSGRYKESPPQEIQRDFPKYEELVKDLINTNQHMIEYKKMMKEIAFKK